MAEQEILPCPNIECRGECCDQESGGSIWWFCLAGCGYSGPMAKTREEATRLHNAMPREEEWIEVAKEGLPTSEESLGVTYDVWSTAGHWLQCALLDDVFRTTWGQKIPQATHYRKHRAPKGPNGKS